MALNQRSVVYAERMTNNLRPIDAKRIAQAGELTASSPAYGDLWFVHSVLAQCFLPYRQTQEREWERSNGDYSILISAGKTKNRLTGRFDPLGLPFGAKPRLFQSYICTQAIKQKSPVIPVEQSMTGMMHELGLKVTGGKTGTIGGFKEQIIRFAVCNFTLVGPGPRGGDRYIKAPPIKKMDVWFPSDPNQKTLWPSEIVLSDDYYYSLKDHAIPFDFRALRTIQNNAKAQDIYLWMTQRLCRLDKPLLMDWTTLHQMFGGAANMKTFKWNFPKELAAAHSVYRFAKIEDASEGYIFKPSPPPIPKLQIVNK